MSLTFADGVEVVEVAPVSIVELGAIPGPAGPPGDVGDSLPPGGTDGQVLTKQSAADGDADWEDPTGSGSGVPDGGTTGQVLRKQSNTDGDAEWETLDAADVGADPTGSAAAAQAAAIAAAASDATTKANAAQAHAVQRANHTGTQAQSTITNLVADLAAKATPADIAAAISALVGGAPGTLDTLGEIADALGEDPNLAATLTALIADKADQADLTAHIDDAAAAHAASAVAVTPTGGLAATDVQGALAELDSEKSSAGHGHAGADITSGTVAYARLPVGTSANTVAAGDDSRMTNTRTPTDDTVSTAKLQDDAVTYAKMQNVSATSRILGRASSGSGDVEELTGAQVASMTGAVSATVIDAKGDLLVGTAADTIARLAAGSNGALLTTDSASSGGVKWGGLRQNLTTGAAGNGQPLGSAWTKQGTSNYIVQSTTSMGFKGASTTGEAWAYVPIGLPKNAQFFMFWNPPTEATGQAGISLAYAAGLDLRMYLSNDNKVRIAKEGVVVWTSTSTAASGANLMFAIDGPLVLAYCPEVMGTTPQVTNFDGLLATFMTDLNPGMYVKNTVCVGANPRLWA